MQAELKWLRTISFEDQRFVRVILDPGDAEKQIGSTSPIFTMVYDYTCGFLIHPIKIERLDNVISLGPQWGNKQVLDNLKRSRKAEYISKEELDTAREWLKLGKSRTTPRYFDLRIRR